MTYVFRTEEELLQQEVNPVPREEGWAIVRSPQGSTGVKGGKSLVSIPPRTCRFHSL